MKYKPSCYSWLAIAPESKIEKLEDQVYLLLKEYKKNQSPQLLQQIEELKKQISQESKHK